MNLANRVAAEARLAEAERLWALCHRIEARLRHGPSTEHESAVRELAADGAELTRGGDQLQSAFAAEIHVRLAQRPDALDRAALLTWWRQTECLVESLPPSELVAARCELAVEWYRVSRQLLVLGGDAPPVVADVARELDRARRMGRLLVARVAPSDADLSVARFRYEHAAQQSDPARELAEADALVSAAYCHAAPAEGVAADRWARLTPAGRAGSDVVQTLRRRRIGETLMRQANPRVGR